MIDGNVYADKDSGKIMVKIGQNYKTHVFISHVLDLNDLRVSMMTIHNQSEGLDLKKVELTKRDKNKMDKLVKELSDMFVYLCQKYEVENE
jgi:hypothetical protein